MAIGTVTMSEHDSSLVRAKDEASGAGVSWPAVFAGSFVMGALALILPCLAAALACDRSSSLYDENRSANAQ